jgi:16S rRNA (cytosine967-C5)-methyltransferase
LASDRGSSTAHRPALVLAEAARAISAVALQGRSADDALARYGQPRRSQAAAARAAALESAIRAVTLGTLRWYLRLDALAAILLEGRALAPVLQGLLVAALHQLEYSRGRPEVTVSSAVDAARLLGQPRAAALINALLRRFLRERVALVSRVAADPVAASAHPAWLLSALQESWPDDWARVVEANNAQPPMTLRVDLTRSALAAYGVELARRDLSGAPLPWCPSAIVLARPIAVDQLPGFAEGCVSVQDAGAQLATQLLQPQAGERVLDACAAPGGKTGALLEATAGRIELTAVDIDAGRLARVADNLRRLRREAQLVCADLTQPPAWWDAQPFDHILLDAPCSAVGVIRRHPDIKLLRRAEDISALAERQRQLLTRCLSMLKPAGRLLYSTCSLLPAENERVFETALAQVPRSQPLSVSDLLHPALAASVKRCGHGIQLLPGSAAGTDGFYYACATVT